MVGSPVQTAEHLAEDMLFIQKLNPQMVGIGPFIPHHDTPFANEKAGTLELTLIYAGTFETDASESAAARHNSAWNDPSEGTGTGHPGRSQCRHAKSVAGECTRDYPCTITKSVPEMRRQNVESVWNVACNLSVTNIVTSRRDLLTFNNVL